jgi:hypothetical protein
MFHSMFQHGPFAQTIFMIAAAQAADDNSPRRGKVCSPRTRARRASRRRMETASRRTNRRR